MNKKTWNDNTDDKSGGFFDLPKGMKPCLRPEHQPPRHLVIPPGKGYRHICPSCGKETVMIPMQITC